MNRQTTRAFGIVIILAATLACNLGAGNPSETAQPSPAAAESQPVASGGLCDNALYPVKEGATWTYLNTGSPSGDFTYTDTVTAVRADGFTLASQFDGLTRTQEWLCETAGLKALQLGGAGATASVSTGGTTAEFKTSEVTGVSLPREITPGLQWQYSLKIEGTTAMPGNQTAQSTSTFSASMQEIGRESVTVPAGTFEAVKIQVTNIVQIVADFQGMQVPVTINGSSVVWYAPGVGYVKSIENSDYGGTPFTSTTELQTYNIP